ncbi:MAG: hypothetical protein HRU20_12055 [Pseudomonadales bacterium]|nr:hypothetical protein [Pseudomonadales bacterium]
MNTAAKNKCMGLFCVIFLLSGCDFHKLVDKRSDNKNTNNVITTSPERETLHAPLSLTSASIVDDFSFQTQRAVRLKLHIPASESETKIAIYIDMDEAQGPSRHLLERGFIKKSTLYSSSIPVPSQIEQLSIVIDDQPATSVAITNNRAEYFFE